MEDIMIHHSPSSLNPSLHFGSLGSCGVAAASATTSTSASTSTAISASTSSWSRYLKDFRVDQCPAFIQHKCTQHKPYTCFLWHFNNQRRRRPIKRADGHFNYSPDVYCTKYDETTGICEDGDECPYLHRTSGDTERRYHLRYFKTGICVYDTDERGHCVKNGAHCAFAHGVHDLRNPVYDVREMLAMDGNSPGDEYDRINGPNSLDKERNALNEDPRWNDLSYVLGNYKTEVCKRPPRLCRQGYACPQYHNSKDKRRPPKMYKYRSTPCPNVKQGDEWGDPANCEACDNCPYCHTRTEQQFHPEIYKSTKCYDMTQSSYCPRGPFCAFAHTEKELSSRHELMNGEGAACGDHTDSGLLKQSSSQSAYPMNGKEIRGNSSNGASSMESRSRSCLLGTSLPDRYGAPHRIEMANPMAAFEQLQQQQQQLQKMPNNHDSFSNLTSNLGVIGSRRRANTASSVDSFYLQRLEERMGGIRRRGSGMLDGSSCFLTGFDPNPNSNGSVAAAAAAVASASSSASSFLEKSVMKDERDVINSVINNAIGESGDMNFDNLDLEDIRSPMDMLSIKTSNSFPNGMNGELFRSEDRGNNGGFLMQNSRTSAPVNIPGRSSERNINLSPPINASPLGSSLGHSMSHNFGISPFPGSNIPHNNSQASSFVNNYGPNIPSELGSSPSTTNLMQQASSRLEINRLQEELMQTKGKLKNWEDGVLQVKQAIEKWKKDVEDSKKREKLYEHERDSAVNRANNLQREVDNLRLTIVNGRRVSDTDLEQMSVNQLHQMTVNNLQQRRSQLKIEMEAIDKVIVAKENME